MVVDDEDILFMKEVLLHKAKLDGLTVQGPRVPLFILLSLPLSLTTFGEAL